MTSGYHQQTAARAFARRIERTSAGLLLVSKTGLLPYLDFDLDRCTADLEKSDQPPRCCRSRPGPGTASTRGTSGCASARC